VNNSSSAKPIAYRGLPALQGRRLTIQAVLLCLGFFAVTTTSIFGTAYSSTDFAGGVAFPRGFFDYGFSAYAEQGIRYGLFPPFLSPVVRGSGYFSYRDNVRLAVGSASFLLKLSPPRPVSGTLGFSPYVSVGPSVNYLYSWADLEDFGSMSESDLSTTLSVFAGADFFSASGLTLFVEGRQTVPSDFTFDYVLVGLKFRGSDLPGTD